MATINLIIFAIFVLGAGIIVGFIIGSYYLIKATTYGFTNCTKCRLCAKHKKEFISDSLRDNK